jgi:alpha-tubulin suppressor-like RCC1 family protein
VVLPSVTTGGAAIPAHAAVTAMPGAGPAAGTLRSWGNNTHGQLGDSSTSNRNTPITVKLPKGTKVTSVRVGCNHSLALTSTGSVLAWGYNHFGQLGNGTRTDRHTPVRVKLPKGTKVTAVRAGCNHSLALTSTGSVLAWGDNFGGALGDGTTTNRSEPVKVKFARGIKIKAISAGGEFSLALTTAGKVLAWGDNPFGQLGDGTTTSRHKPVRVKFPGGTVIKNIAGGGFHALAISTAGLLFAWGLNAAGELGDGTNINHAVPERIIILLKGVGPITGMFAGCYHTVVLTSSGAVLAWGDNFYGQLGNGTTTSSNIAVRTDLLVGLTLKAVSAGCFDSYALTTSGRLLAWGNNGSGELGDGSTVGIADSPVEVKLPARLFALAIGTGPEAVSSMAIVRAR